MVLCAESGHIEEKSVNIVVISPDTVLCPSTITTSSKVNVLCICSTGTYINIRVLWIQNDLVRIRIPTFQIVLDSGPDPIL